LISILIPNYNRAKLIIETLESIQKQTYDEWECIIVDDGSTDDSVDVIQDFIKEDQRFLLLKRPINLCKGASSCRNYAFSFSKGNFIQFFDSDDIMHPNHLKEKIENIHGKDFIICKLLEFQNEFDAVLLKKDSSDHLNLEENVFEAFVTGLFPMMMVAPMWKKSSLLPHMPIREDLTILEDHELYARVLSSKVSFAVINKALIYYRVGGLSLMNTFYRNVNNGLDSYLECKKTVLSISDSNTVKLALLKMVLAVFRLGLAQKDYDATKKILNFIEIQNLANSVDLNLKMLRIKIFYFLIKRLGRGDTFLKPMLKL